MDRKLRRQLRKSLLLAFKIGLGSSLAICIAQFLELDNSVAAGSITLLTLMTTKWGTVRLSIYRLITFLICVAMAFCIYHCFGSTWVDYGLFVFLTVAVCDLMGWTAAISVNALIGAHFLETMDFSRDFIWNEFQLVLIGICLAFVISLVYNYRGEKNHLIRKMRDVEGDLQMILGELAAYLSNKNMQRNVWEDIEELEKNLKRFIDEAKEYQDNTFQSHPGYYIDYFEMRLDQCDIIYNLHSAASRMRYMPVQARVVAEYILYMADYVIEHNTPDIQLRRLEEILRNMEKEELPASREEFESRALLYHILMDLEEFLLIKSRFVEGLDETKRKLYWDQGAESFQNK